MDLNSVGDEDATTCPFSSWKLHAENGVCSASPASSSSSSRQPSLGDFDLNSDPYLPEACGSCNLEESSTKAHGGPTCHPVIKIMGSEIAVERNCNANQVPNNYCLVRACQPQHMAMLEFLSLIWEHFSHGRL